MSTPCSLCNEESFPEIALTYCANCYCKVVEERDALRVVVKIQARDMGVMTRTIEDQRIEINELRLGEMKLGEA